MGGRGVYADRRKQERRQAMIQRGRRIPQRRIIGEPEPKPQPKPKPRPKSEPSPRKLEIVRKGQLSGADIIKFRERINSELPRSDAWKHPSGRRIAEWAITSFAESADRKGIVVARDEATGTFRGVTTYTPGRKYVYVDFLSGMGGGTGTELLQTVIRENPGSGIQLTPLDTARSYYRSVGMHDVGGYMGFEPEEAAQFAQHGRDWHRRR